MRVSFTIPGSPVPQPRARARAFAGHAQVYNPTTTRDGKALGIQEWRYEAKQLAREAMRGRALMLGAVQLTVWFVMPRPKDHFGTGRNAGRLKPNAPYWHTKKPDRANLLRGLEDALKGVVWQDDSQTADGRARKRYTQPDEEPHTLVVIEELQDQECLPGLAG